MMICYLNRPVIILIIIILSSITQPICALAVDAAPRISDREIVEGLAEIRGDIKRLEQRFEAVDKRFDAVDKRFEGVDKRFDSFERQMNQRFDDIKWFLGVMIGTLLVINTGVLGYVLKRQGSMEKSLETIKDEMSFLKGVIEKLLPPKSVL